MTTVVIYRVLPRDGKDGTEYGLERTYRSLVPPAPEAVPTSRRRATSSLSTTLPSAGQLIRGWRPA